MSKRSNPFQKNNNANTGPAMGMPDTNLTHDEPLGRTTGRQSLRQDEQVTRQLQYRRFMDNENESKNFMTKTAGRQMVIDTKRPLHRVWMWTMGIMTVYIISKWTWQLTRPKYYNLMDTTHQGYSVSMSSEAELALMGTLTDQVPYIGKGLTHLEQTAIKDKKRELNNKKFSEQDQIIPCYSSQTQFKQCMSYDQMRRKLDQCMPALQTYNMCMIKHRTTTSDIDVEKRQDFFNAALFGAKPAQQLNSITTAASNVITNSNSTGSHNADYFMVPVDHDGFRY